MRAKAGLRAVSGDRAGAEADADLKLVARAPGGQPQIGVDGEAGADSRADIDGGPGLDGAAEVGGAAGVAGAAGVTGRGDGEVGASSVAALRSTAELSAVRARRQRRRGFGPIELLLADPSITEIMINGPGPVLVDRTGRAEPSGYRLTRSELDALIERLLDPLGLQLDRTRPVVDARLDDGSRVSIVASPAAHSGPILTIRRFGREVLILDDFGPPSMVAALAQVVAERRNILVVGGTSTGKTSLLNALAAHFDPDDRVITIEDTAELMLPGRHVVALEARVAGRARALNTSTRTCRSASRQGARPSRKPMA
jgi:hypothetical protein